MSWLISSSEYTSYLVVVVVETTTSTNGRLEWKKEDAHKNLELIKDKIRAHHAFRCKSKEETYDSAQLIKMRFPKKQNTKTNSLITKNMIPRKIPLKFSTTTRSRAKHWKQMCDLIYVYFHSSRDLSHLYIFAHQFQSSFILDFVILIVTSCWLLNWICVSVIHTKIYSI